MHKFLMVLIMIVLVGLFFQTGQAQITIPNSGSVYSPGTPVNTWQIDSIDMNIYNQFTATAGGNQTWDLTGRSFSKENLGVVVDKSGAPMADSFATANLVVLTVDTLVPPDSIWTFTEQDPLSITTWGTVGHVSGTDEYIFKYQTATPDVVYPMSYNSQWIGTHMYTVSLAADIYSEYYDSVFNTVDAWGTITYGGNTVPCLRVSYVSRFTSKSYVSGMLISTNVTTQEGAEFFGEGFKYLFNLGKDTSGGVISYYADAGDDLVSGPTGVRENNPGMVPTGYDLAQNYPNPFNPSTDIQFSLPRNTAVHLSIYNMLGQEVKTLIDQPMDAGNYTVDWNGTDDEGQAVASGIYFYRLTAGDFTRSKKMALVK